MISALATVITRHLFPSDHALKATQPASLLSPRGEPAPVATAVAPSTRQAPPVLFRQQDALLALLTEIARRRLDDAGAGR